MGLGRHMAFVFMLVVLSFGCACAKPWRHLRKATLWMCEHSAADFLPPAHMASVDAQRCAPKNNNFHSFTFFFTERCAHFLVRCGSLFEFCLRFSLQRKFWRYNLPFGLLEHKQPIRRQKKRGIMPGSIMICLSCNPIRFVWPIWLALQRALP